jgi:hypothetical protein
LAEIACRFSRQGKPDTRKSPPGFRCEHRLVWAPASVISVLDPEVIVLGGGMSNAKWLYENGPAPWAG